MTVAGPAVLYVAGAGRSGTTLVDRLLGQAQGFVSCGELAHIWERGFQNDEDCGCGRAFSRCEFWQRVRADVLTTVDLPSILQMQRSVARFRHLWRLQNPRGLFEKTLHEYRNVLGRLYRSIHKHSGQSIIVDSSKTAQHLRVLQGVDSLACGVLHLVRDPRAVAHSWTRLRPRPEKTSGSEFMPRYSPARSAAEWHLVNRLCDGLNRGPDPYLRLRYEDLMANPAEVLTRVASLVGKTVEGYPFLEQRTVDLEVAHTASGNPMRFHTGPLTLREDDVWRRELRRHDRALVRVLTWPLAGRYGYDR